MKFYIIFVALFVLLISILFFTPKEQKQISLAEHLIKEGIVYRGADGYLYNTDSKKEK